MTASSDHYPSNRSISELQFKENDKFFASMEGKAQNYILVKELSSEKVGFVPVSKLKVN